MIILLLKDPCVARARHAIIYLCASCWSLTTICLCEMVAYMMYVWVFFFGLKCMRMMFEQISEISPG